MRYLASVANGRSDASSAHEDDPLTGTSVAVALSVMWRAQLTLQPVELLVVYCHTRRLSAFMQRVSLYRAVAP
jgi:hypothetical protein